MAQQLLTVPDAAKLFKKNRTTIYRHCSSGVLSFKKDNQGITKIQVSELIRCYGEPPNAIAETVAKTDTGQQKDYLQLLETQLQAQIEREKSYQQQIEVLNNVINGLKDSISGLNGVISTLSNNRISHKIPENTHNAIAETVAKTDTGQQRDNRDYSRDKQPEPKKRGLFSRILNG